GRVSRTSGQRFADRDRVQAPRLDYRRRAGTAAGAQHRAGAERRQVDSAEADDQSGGKTDGRFRLYQMDGAEPGPRRLRAGASGSLVRDRSMVGRDRRAGGEGVERLRVRCKYVLRSQSGDGAGIPVAVRDGSGRPGSARRADVAVLKPQQNTWRWFL